jgi:hypothetical protein
MHTTLQSPVYTVNGPPAFISGAYDQRLCPSTISVVVNAFELLLGQHISVSFCSMTASPKSSLRTVSTLLLAASSPVLILATLGSCIWHIISFWMSHGYMISYLTLLQILTSLISAPPLLPVTESNFENGQEGVSVQLDIKGWDSWRRPRRAAQGASGRAMGATEQGRRNAFAVEVGVGCHGLPRLSSSTRSSSFVVASQQHACGAPAADIPEEDER